MDWYSFKITRGADVQTHCNRLACGFHHLNSPLCFFHVEEQLRNNTTTKENLLVLYRFNSTALIITGCRCTGWLVTSLTDTRHAIVGRKDCVMSQKRVCECNLVPRVSPLHSPGSEVAASEAFADFTIYTIWRPLIRGQCYIL